MNLVDPRPVHPSQDFDVRIGRQKLRLLAGGRSLSFDGLATNNPPHGRITSETVGVVYVLITTKATKHRLTELPRHAVPSVLAGTAVLENSPGNLGQAKGIIKLPIGQQPAVRGDLGPVKFQLQAAVETRSPSRFDSPIVPFIVPPIAIIHLIIILESALRPSEIIVYLGNAGFIAQTPFFHTARLVILNQNIRAL